MSWRVSVAMLSLLVSMTTQANPYPDPNAVPKDGAYSPRTLPDDGDDQSYEKLSTDVLRIEIGWATGEQYKLNHAVIESSGTPALAARATRQDPYGSYRGTIIDPTTGQVLAYDALGTGQAYRLLVRALSFRFPLPDRPVIFRLVAENPTSGAMEKVFETSIDPRTAPRLTPPSGGDFAVTMIKAASAEPKLMISIYADGYAAARRSNFLRAAQRVADTITGSNIPLKEHFEYRAVFQTSVQALGKAQNLGMPIPERNSFLGLYFPYWDKTLTRWYHVVYPTVESRFRTGIGSVPYDYPIVLLDSGDYWGVGNFNELTAIPAESSSFTYLLLHELGHYFGLNEEYEGGGPTELAFAPNITEPWSQNITFNTNRQTLKWGHLVDAGTAIPTPSDQWRGSGPYGAYRGGYADSLPRNRSHKPGKSCTMASGRSFCPICTHALAAKINFDLGRGGTGGTCECKPEAGECVLMRQGQKLASTPLWDGASCDASFCSRYFRLSLRSLCGANP